MGKCPSKLYIPIYGLKYNRPPGSLFSFFFNEEEALGLSLERGSLRLQSWTVPAWKPSGISTPGGGRGAQTPPQPHTHSGALESMGDGQVASSVLASSLLLLGLHWNPPWLKGRRVGSWGPCPLQLLTEMTPSPETPVVTTIPAAASISSGGCKAPQGC